MRTAAIARLLIVLAGIVPCCCHAELSVKQYMGEKNQYIQSANKMYVVGIGDGLSWANTELKSQGLPYLYCVPTKLPLDGNTYLHILDLQIQEMRKWAEWPEIKEWPVPMLLLKALKQTFPCQAPGASPK
jgi:hypothetical protein